MIELMPYLAAFLSLVGGASFFFAHEGIRGAGRIVDGLACLLVAFCILIAMPMPTLIVATCFAVSGLVKIVVGVRKYLRR